MQQSPEFGHPLGILHGIGMGIFAATYYDALFVWNGYCSVYIVAHPVLIHGDLFGRKALGQVSASTQRSHQWPGHWHCTTLGAGDQTYRSLRACASPRATANCVGVPLSICLRLCYSRSAEATAEGAWPPF